MVHLLFSVFFLTCCVYLLALLMTRRNNFYLSVKYKTALCLGINKYTGRPNHFHSSTLCHFPVITNTYLIKPQPEVFLCHISKGNYLFFVLIFLCFAFVFHFTCDLICSLAWLCRKWEFSHCMVWRSGK